MNRGTSGGGILRKIFTEKTLKGPVALERAYRGGEVIFREGDPASELFIIMKGEVSVLKKSGGRDIVLSVLSQGEFFGEMAIFERARRSATVKANTETRVRVMYPGSFLMSIRQDPVLAFQIFQKMSKRLRILNGELARVHTLLEEHGIEDRDALKLEF